MAAVVGKAPGRGRPPSPKRGVREPVFREPVLNSEGLLSPLLLGWTIDRRRDSPPAGGRERLGIPQQGRADR